MWTWCFPGTVNQTRVHDRDSSESKNRSWDQALITVKLTGDNSVIERLYNLVLKSRSGCRAPSSGRDLQSFVKTRPTRKRLEVLPLELISMIFKNLGNDLVAHVTFSTLQPDIYDFCYKGLDRNFGEGFFVLAGSLLSHGAYQALRIGNSDMYGMYYDTFAEELVRTRTERGASCMRTWDVSLDDDERGFKKHAGQLILRPRCTWPDVSFVRPYASVSADDDDTLQYGDELVQHPILWRSFASFPPVNKFGIMACGPDWIEPSNDRGVVVADVLQQILDADKSPPMNSADIAELIDRSRLKWSEKSDPWPVVPRNWDLSDTFNALQGIVDWLIIVRWTKLRIEELFDKQIACDMEFKAQKLPENYEDFDRLTTLNY
ncbi:hypothetical protein BC629DRAFT_1442761 [Irpex lacteus]|nr:hypothetical protein BC629DRAFT_1442761 [Irpex lacteus]